LATHSIIKQKKLRYEKDHFAYFRVMRSAILMSKEHGEAGNTGGVTINRQWK